MPVPMPLDFASLVVRWQYDYRPEPGSPEAALYDCLRPRDWLAEASARSS